MTGFNFLKYIDREKTSNYVSNFSLAVLYLIFSLNFLLRFFKVFNSTFDSLYDFKESLLLLLFFTSQISLACLFLFRKKPVSNDNNLSSWIFAGLGTFLPLFFVFNKVRSNFLLEGATLVGAAISFYSLLSLGRSTGIIPSNRGIVKKGLYSYVRHPMYLGYIISFSAFLMMTGSLTYNLTLFTIWIFAIYKRIAAEEKFLSEDKDYRKYSQSTKYRLIPYVW